MIVFVRKLFVILFFHTRLRESDWLENILSQKRERSRDKRKNSFLTSELIEIIQTLRSYEVTEIFGHQIRIQDEKLNKKT